MNSTWIQLAQWLAGVFGFAIPMLAPGFLLAHALDLCAFRVKSTEEKLLWSICLSLPLAIQICVLSGRLLPPAALMPIFAGLGAVSVALLLRSQPRLAATKTSKPTFFGRRERWIVILLASSAALYLAAAVTDIQSGHRLYVGTVIYDWSVRIPMIAAAMRSAVPPVNGLSALHGQPAALRYFYFWYVVCADVARTLHLPARAAIAASCAWALWALLAVFFLFLKYTLRLGRDLRACCVLSFLVLAVMGLDLLPTIPLFGIRRLHPYAEIEWWHQDRTPSLLSSAMYAPHHVAAFACLLTGLLVLSLTLRRGDQQNGNSPLWKSFFASLVAGVCFASAAGSSILPTVTVAIVCMVWAIDLALRREWRCLSALAGSAVTALLFAASFLRELTTTAGAVSGSFVSLRWRNYDFVHQYAAKYRLLGPHAILNQAIVQGGVLTINLFDLGFFLFVLVHQIRRDSRRSLNGTERAMWAFVCGTAIPYFFLSSASIASPNDLGVDAGLLLRLLLQMWAVPWLYSSWVARRRGWRMAAAEYSSWRRIACALAMGCLALGLAGQVFQVLWERLYFPLVGSQTLPRQMDLMTTDHLAERLYNIREAYQRLDKVEPSPAGIIQYNPIGPMQPALTFYSTHQIAAFDIGCGTGYGGDYAACQRLMPGLLALYGNTRAGFDRGRAGNDRQDDAAVRTATTGDAVEACRQLHLVALVAESTDSIWSRHDSWVWTMHPVVASSTVRIFNCPQPGATQ